MRWVDGQLAADEEFVELEQRAQVPGVLPEAEMHRLGVCAGVAR